MTDCNNKHMYFELLTRLKSWFNDSQQTSWISEKINKDRPQGPGWVRENGQFSFISRPTAPSKRVLSENLFGTLQSSEEKNIGQRLKRDPFPFLSSWKNHLKECAEWKWWTNHWNQGFQWQSSSPGFRIILLFNFFNGNRLTYRIILFPSIIITWLFLLHFFQWQSSPPSWHERKLPPWKFPLSTNFAFFKAFKIFLVLKLQQHFIF